MIYPASNQYIDTAIKSLKNGKIIVYPTDTIYGFGVDATNTLAIQKLNQLKNRAQPLSIIINSIYEIKNYGNINSSMEKILNKIFPGPFTALLNAKTNKLSPLVQNGSKKIGIRIPNHFFPLSLTNKLQKPIITTSINRHGDEPINDVKKVKRDFPNIDIYEDPQHVNSIGSTIIDFTNKAPSIIRQGDGMLSI